MTSEKDIIPNHARDKHLNRANQVENINILGVNISDISKRQTLDKIQEYLRSHKQYFIVTPNPEIILEATEKDEELWYILNHADIALADGIALKIAAWFQGKNIERITGADLTPGILKLAEVNNYKVAVFIWNRGLSGVNDIKQAIAKKFPKLEIYVEAIERDSAYLNAIPPTLFIKGANLFAPEIVFCALGSPYQEKFIYYNLPKIFSAKLGLPVGGSFDFLTGKIKRAPKFLRFIGLEWLWRLIKQPKRFKRIYRATIVFPFRFLYFFIFLRWFYRPNVACLLFKRENGAYKILIVERVGEKGHWQLPQGGTDGEDITLAGARELREETGIENIKLIAVFKNIFRYKFPIKTQRGYKGQKQSLFIAEFIGSDSEIKVNDWEHSGWRWVEAEKLIETLHPVRREAAMMFMDKFWEEVNPVIAASEPQSRR